MIAVVLLAVIMVTVTAYGLTNSVFAQGPPKFIVNLTGDEEVPPAQTNTTGTADISAFDVSDDSITYAINVSSIEGATAGHIHLGKQGENGPIVVTLFKYDSPMNQVMETGTVTADKLEGPMKDKPMSDLALTGLNGSLYINVHTEQYPDGEIRGQIENP